MLLAVNNAAGVCLLAIISTAVMPRGDLGDDTSSVDVLPLKDIGASFTIPITFFGYKIPFVIDTECDCTVINTSFTNFLSQEPMEATISSGSSTVHTNAVYKGVTMTIGTRQYQPEIIVAANLSALAQISGEYVRGILGKDILTNWAVAIDHLNEEVALQGHEAPLFPLPKNNVPLRLLPSGSFVFTGSVGNNVPLTLTVDSGSYYSVSLNPNDWNLVFPHGPKKTIQVTSSDFGGSAVETVLARLPSLTIGSERYDDLLCYRISKTNALSRVGWSLLKRNRTIIDYPHRRLYMSRIERPVADEWDTTGMDLSWTERGRPSVTFVDPHGPAFAAGISAKDEIISIDDRPIELFSKREFWDLFHSSARRTLKLWVLRDGRELEVHLRRRRMI